jgi:hypothetical protein
MKVITSAVNPERLRKEMWGCKWGILAVIPQFGSPQHPVGSQYLWDTLPRDPCVQSLGLALSSQQNISDPIFLDVLQTLRIWCRQLPSVHSQLNWLLYIHSPSLVLQKSVSKLKWQWNYIVYLNDVGQIESIYKISGPKGSSTDRLRHGFNCCHGLTFKWLGMYNFDNIHWWHLSGLIVRIMAYTMIIFCSLLSCASGKSKHAWCHLVTLSLSVDLD